MMDSNMNASIIEFAMWALGHDWFWFMANDWYAREQGRQNQMYLRKLAQGNPDKQALLDYFERQVHTAMTGR